MYNTRLDGLTEYPFQRLAALLEGVEPARGLVPVVMSIGEPQHAPPALLLSALNAAAGDWGKYPPTAGTAEYRTAVADWCRTRYRLPVGFVDAEKHVLPLAGSREGLFMAAQLCVPPTKNGVQPAVLMPSPFYQVYFGAAVMNGAKPVFVAATRESGFMPDYSAVARADL